MYVGYSLWSFKMLKMNEMEEWRCACWMTYAMKLTRGGGGVGCAIIERSERARHAKKCMKNCMRGLMV